MRRYKRIFKIPTPKDKPLTEQVLAFQIDGPKDGVILNFAAPKKGIVKNAKVVIDNLTGSDRVILRIEVVSEGNMGFVDIGMVEEVNDIPDQAEMMEGDLLKLYIVDPEKKLDLRRRKVWRKEELVEGLRRKLVDGGDGPMPEGNKTWEVG